MKSTSTRSARRAPTPGGTTARSGMPVYAVIMAGGHGTRFWPRSRRRLPKQLLCLSGERSLLQETAGRLRPLVSWRNILVVTNVEHAAEVRRQLPRLPRDQILAEPVGRNTLPCLALANEWILARRPDALVVVAPADHVIRDGRGFVRTIRRALDTARAEPALVTVGIQPTRPETGYGYIETAREGARLRVRRFREKPSLSQARRFLARGNFLWNAGMFAWRASTFAEAVRSFAPETARLLSGVWLGAVSSSVARLRRIYAKVPNVSVDVGIMEPASVGKRAGIHVAVVPAGFDWSDVGSWVALPDVLPTNADRNTVVGKVIAVDAVNSIIFSPDRLVALVGLKDVIVVDSPDALLICARDRAQDVRRVTQELERKRLGHLL